jgi:CO/xanthine dehydrogenase FAD-binding subunit
LLGLKTDTFAVVFVKVDPDPFSSRAFMKPAPFKYVAASSLEHALSLKAEHGDEARFLAGGQSLIPTMNFCLARPSVLIDINGLKDLAGVDRSETGGARVGALTRYRDLERNCDFLKACPLFADALPHIAHPQIRNRGTIGGNLSHADPASELPALAVAMQARMRIKSSRGERDVPASEFFMGLLTTDIADDEMLVEITYPAPKPRTKDNILAAGLRATWGSRLYRDFVPGTDVTPAARLREAGAVILGKTNVPQFTLHGFTDNELFGVTGNPWNVALTPGGSSGGAVAAVASGMGALALGTDGGGSIRRPAAHTGLVGFKPSRAMVPRDHGFPAILYNFEVAGPIARCVDDAIATMDVIAGANWLHGDAAPVIQRPRIAYTTTFSGAPVDPLIRDRIDRTRRRGAVLWP